MTWDRPRVVVVGAGAMGCLFGGLLAAGGLPVTLVDIWKEHVQAIRRDGLRMVGYGGERTIALQATDEPAALQAADVVLFQCKAFANEAAAASVRHVIGPSTVVISFQNGLGNEERLGAALGMEHMVGGLTAQGAGIVGPGVVHNFGDLPSYIGELGGGLSERCVAIAQAFTRHGLPTTASASIKREKWQKLLGNAALGAFSAATDMNSAEMVAVPALRAMILRALDETAAVAAAAGVVLDEAQKRAIFDKLTSVGQGGTGLSKSSMAVDIGLRRRAEIATRHGAGGELGRELGVPTPTLETMVAVVKALESKYLGAAAAGA
jgi:2-dehydropantoate 2-reductase